MAAENLLRHGEGHRGDRVTNVELFFDLVFVFAITQLSHAALKHMTPLGGLQTLLLLAAVWWVWIFTSWVTNWLDPDRVRVRLLLFAMMFGGLLLSVSIPEAFGARGLVFGATYATMQVGRSLFMLWAVRRADGAHLRNFQRITAWLAAGAVFWIAGGLAPPEARLPLWAIGLAIEYAAPAAGFFVPGLGRSQTSDWRVRGGHMAERCALFIIIVLGESLLVTGATFEALHWTALDVGMFAAAFVGSVATWWIYFNVGAERGQSHISGSGDPGRMARFGYTYLHLIIVGGVLLSAIADEMVLVHPAGHMSLPMALAVIGGPAVYLAGNALFKRVFTGHFPLSHQAGLGALAALALAAPLLEPYLLYLGTTACLVGVAVWETVSLRTWRLADPETPHA